MALTTADKTAVRTYLKALYSEKQLIEWTNPDHDSIPKPTTVDDDFLDSIIVSAFQMYSIYYSSNFTNTNNKHLDLLSRAVIHTFRNWRNVKDDTESLIKLFESARDTEVLRQTIQPHTVDRTASKANIDSDYASGLNTKKDWGDKL